jgi:hypothetical protein
MTDGNGSVPALTPALLADLQAGLLDDATARRVREQVRNDPQAARRLAALDRVRTDLANLGADAPSAPPVPGEVTARVVSALRNAPPPNVVTGDTGREPPAHTARPAALRHGRLLAAGAGAGAALAAIVVGATALVGTPATTRTAGVTAEQITVGPVHGVPLSDAQILALITRPADLGPLGNPRRLESCLTGLGYPTDTKVLGARPLTVRGRPAVLLVLAADSPERLAALAVAPGCDAARAGLLADTLVTRP